MNYQPQKTVPVVRALNTFLVSTTITLFLLAGGCQRSDQAATDRIDSDAAPLDQATRLFNNGQIAEAHALVRDALIQTPDCREAHQMLVHLYAAEGKLLEAVQATDDLAALTSGPEGASALMNAFEWCLKLGDFTRAEVTLRKAIQHQPQGIDSRRTLFQLLNAQGRRSEAIRELQILCRLAPLQPGELFALVDQNSPVPMVSFEGYESGNQSPFELGKLRMKHLVTTDGKQVLTLLQRYVKDHPKNTAACAFLGRVLAEFGDVDALERWAENLPVGIEDEPEYWNAIGNWLALRNEHAQAVRSFCEALARNPSDRQSLRAMASCLQMMRHEKQAATILENLTVLDRVFQLADEADADQADWIAEQLHGFHQPWVSTAWFESAEQKRRGTNIQLVAFNSRREELREWEARQTTAQRLAARIAKLTGLDPQDFPLPEIGRADSLPKTYASQHESLPTTVALVDVADSVGINTTYNSGYPLEASAHRGPRTQNTPTYRIHQSNGGGMAVIDYDLDSRCDLYIAQGGGDPRIADDSAPNQLLRNTPGGFKDVTLSARTGDRGYGQGVTSADLNQDGFMDLLVANVGKNTVYLNQGDGTFRDASGLLLNNAARWTSSLGVGDLNGDHLPEIVEVNYLDDPKALRDLCDPINGELCQPQSYRKAEDFIHLAQQNGTFTPWDAIAETKQLPNYGFGVVIGNFDCEHGNDVFVSNDGSENHLWTSVPAGSDNYELIESAAIRGISVGMNGNSQACMGIGFGDFDRNGRIDFHVTNYFNQSANLFMQSESSVFVDDPARKGLVAPSRQVLGFGTHAFDADNNGWLDLAVLNGHLQDLRLASTPFRMKPQLFIGGINGFQTAQLSSNAKYWSKPALGRTLAVADWNRDGRQDLIANHLDAPVALLENQTKETGNWLQLELAGTLSEREAIGAQATVSAGGRQWTSWQIGGDGYMCTNESVLHFGLGDTPGPLSIEIQWPSGSQVTFSNVSPNRRYLAIEDRSALLDR